MFAVFLICLVGGLAATAALAALGQVTGHLHGGGHAVLGHAQAAHLPAHGGHGTVPTHGPALQQASSSGHHVQAASGSGPGWPGAALGWTLSWLSPLSIAAAAMLFGGVGLLVEPASGTLAVPVAVVAGLLGAAAVRALLGAFERSSTTPLQAAADGALGTLSAPIRPDAAGEVIYTLEGLHRSAPARSLDGRPLPRGAEVVIVRRERGMAWVAPLDAMPAGIAPDAAHAAPGSREPQAAGDPPPPAGLPPPAGQEAAATADPARRDE